MNTVHKPLITILDLVSKVLLVLQKGGFQDKMSKSALLETLILVNRARVVKNEGSFLSVLMQS